MSPATIARSATLFCVFFSARIGTGFLRGNPRLFTVMALFACSWAVLLPYYGTPDSMGRAELLSALGGFLAVYAGGLLMLHARAPHEPAHDVVPWQVAGMYLLWVIVAQSALQIPGPPGGHLFGLSLHQTELGIGLVLDLAGFAAIGLGMQAGRRQTGFSSACADPRRLRFGRSGVHRAKLECPANHRTVPRALRLPLCRAEDRLYADFRNPRGSYRHAGEGPARRRPALDPDFPLPAQ